MNLKFSKRVLENYNHPIHGLVESCVVYAVYSKEGLLGTFLLSERAGFIDFDETSLRIDIAHYVFKNDRYLIVDSRSESPVGEYRIPIILGGIMALGTMLLEGKVYSCKKQRPDVRYSPFKKSTWGHYKVSVSNEAEEVIYKLKVDVPIIDVPNTSQRPFDGEVQTNTVNLKLLFCGLFLLEQVFAVKDNQMV